MIFPVGFSPDAGGLGPADLALPAAVAPLLEYVPELATTGDPYRTYIDSLDADTSKATMRGCLDAITRMVLKDELGEDPGPVSGECRTWWNLRYEHTTRIRAKLIERHESHSTVNKHLVGLRRILKECWRLGRMTADEYHRAADLASIKGDREPVGRSVHDEELAAMLTVCANQPAPRGVRNAAMVGVLYCSGLRRAEAAGLLIERYDPGTRALKVVGKRNKERTVYVIRDVVPHVDAWLSALGARRGPMFRPITKHGHIGEAGMSPKAVGAIIAEVRTAAGLPPLTTHDLRRTYVSNLLDQGVDLATAQKLAGHASPDTTARYDRRPERLLQEANDKLRLPVSGAPCRTDRAPGSQLLPKPEGV